MPCSLANLDQKLHLIKEQNDWIEDLQWNFNKNRTEFVENLSEAWDNFRRSLIVMNVSNKHILQKVDDYETKINSFIESYKDFNEKHSSILQSIHGVIEKGLENTKNELLKHWTCDF